MGLASGHKAPFSLPLMDDTFSAAVVSFFMQVSHVGEFSLGLICFRTGLRVTPRSLAGTSLLITEVA